MKLIEKEKIIWFQDFRELGFEIPEIDGAFYIFAKIPAEYRELGAMEFCKLLAKEARCWGYPWDSIWESIQWTSLELVMQQAWKI